MKQSLKPKRWKKSSSVLCRAGTREKDIHTCNLTIFIIS